MKKIIVPILAMVLVFSLIWIAGAQTSSSGQSGYGTSGSSSQYGTSGSQQYGTGQSGSSQSGFGPATPPDPYKTRSDDQTGSNQQYGTGYGNQQPGMGQQYRGRESQERYGRGMYGNRQGKSMEDYRASRWIGMTVQNRQGEDLGEIEDLVISPKGRVEFVIVSQEGASGMEERYTAVPFKAFSRRGDEAILNISKEKMAEAPSFDINNWPDMYNRKWSNHIYRYYGQKPYWSESTYKYKSYQKSKSEPSKKME